MGHKSQQPRPVSRDGFWYLVRRVPKHYAHLDPRSLVVLSTGIAIPDDPRGIRARQKVVELDDTLQTFWSGLTTPVTPAQIRATRRAQRLMPSARQPAVDVPTFLAMPHTEMWNRFVAFTNALDVPDTLPASTLLTATKTCFGSAVQPATTTRMMVSDLLTEFQRIKATDLTRKSPRQLSKWRVRRQSALDLFITVIGSDVPAQHLTKQHTDKFRSHWQARIREGSVRINSANRQMRQVAGLYRAVAAYHQWDVKNPFAALRIGGGRDGKRLAYPASYVQEYLLRDGLFDGIHPELRRIIYLIAETGLRPSEACALRADTIHLNGPIPFVHVTNDKQDTKTPGSVRRVPLVGVALLAMRLQPQGFIMYSDKPDHVSALVNKALASRDLRPQGQTLYSLRHTLIDRLKAVEAPKDIQEDIVGHVHMYGEGTTLEHRHHWLQRISFKPPTSI